MERKARVTEKVEKILIVPEPKTLRKFLLSCNLFFISGI